MKLNMLAHRYKRIVRRINAFSGKPGSSLPYVAGFICAVTSACAGYHEGGGGWATGLGCACFFAGWIAARDFPRLVAQLVGTINRLAMTTVLAIVALAMIRFLPFLSLGVVLFVVVSVYVLYSRIVCDSE